ncbi:hypothetical protein [Spartinivicinus ruber]|uniref:hypothetical protein n=1 Tax=Spartinivicinus ruber TaxID=2683272 RepID=UPI0013D1EAF9|nr:hypothetical protein [Spartinivicinus ruber]
MISSESLIKGKTYYLIGFYDDALKIPDIETYIYVGKNLLSDDGAWYFQCPQTFLKQGPFNELPPGDYSVMRADEDTLEMMYDSQGIVNLLTNLQEA